MAAAAPGLVVVAQREFLDDCARVARALARAVAPSFGPLGHDQLVVELTGSLLVCRSGRAALSAARAGPDAPQARLVLAALAATERRVGDGSSALVLMLAGALEAVQAMASGTGGSRALRRLGRAVTWLRADLLRADGANALGELAALRVAVTRSGGVEAIERTDAPGALRDVEAFVRTGEALARSALAHQFAHGTQIELVRLVSAWLRCVLEANAGAPRGALMVAAARGFSRRAVSFAPAASASLSVLGVSALLVDRPPLHRARAQAEQQQQGQDFQQVPPPFRASGGGNVAVVLVACRIAPVERSDGAAVLVSSAAEMVGALGFQRARVAETLTALLHRVPRLRLLLCCEELPDPALELLERAGVMAAQRCPHSLCEDWEALSGAQPVSDLRDLPILDSACVGWAECVREVRLGSQGWAVLVEGIVLARERECERSMWRLPQVVLRGPSAGLLEQYRRALARVGQLLAAWATDMESGGGDVLVGGCAAELAVFRALQRRAGDCRARAAQPVDGDAHAHAHAVTWLAREQACAVISHAALAVPVALLANADGAAGRRDWAAALQRLGPQAGRVRVSPDGKAELVRLALLGPESPVEPLALKTEQLFALLALLEQLLRVDMLCAVRGGADGQFT
jgi:hypothetical protein